jgi:methylmalonyl-CoA/ethylmalonyl-CoA epimerase
MDKTNDILAKLELAQICWVVPDIRAASGFLAGPLRTAGFPEAVRMRAQDLGMTHHGRVVDAEWLTTQTYNRGIFLELVQPLSGQSMFHDYLARHPEGGVQHMAFRLPVAGFSQVVDDLRRQGHAVISEVDHPIARMAFFDTYRTLGHATEIMGVTPEGWAAIQQMQQAR